MVRLYYLAVKTFNKSLGKSTAEVLERSNYNQIKTFYKFHVKPAKYKTN